MGALIKTTFEVGATVTLTKEALLLANADGYYEGIGDGPFRVKSTHHSDAVMEPDHPQVLTIEIPVGDKDVSGLFAE